jgi:co-chaperonin GroES (HSP10)
MSDFDYELNEKDIVNPLPDVILVTNMEHGERKTAAGIIIPDDNGTSSGVKPRFGTVYKIGKNVEDIAVGDKVLVAHGRWTRGVKIRELDGGTTVIRRVDPKDILLVMEQDVS